MYGAIEAGGTKFICAITDDSGAIVDRIQFPTAEPATTVDNIVEFFTGAQQQHGAVRGIGVGSFGPIRVDMTAADYGCFLNTPKPGWSHFDLRGALQDRTGVSVVVETDVNTAILAEARCGAAEGLNSAVYVTVGTGIGGGVYAGGRLLPGFIHPEIGHIRVPRHPRDEYAGHCPFHGDCLEGLACGPAMAARWGVPAETLPADHLAWEIQAYYLAAMCVNLCASFSPERIIIGGGVLGMPGLLARVHSEFTRLWGDYLPLPEGGVEAFIVAPKLAPEAGLVGAILLAQDHFSAAVQG